MIFLSLGSNLSSLSGDNRFDYINGSIDYFCLHGSQILILSFKFKIRNLKHKISFSNRNRITSSPEEWVQDLKTFNRYDISYSVFFKKISFGK